jgi:hypothetical protein
MLRRSPIGSIRRSSERRGSGPKLSIVALEDGTESAVIGINASGGDLGRRSQRAPFVAVQEVGRQTA